MGILRNYFWWTYERGSLHYDVMVTLILAFLFLGPRFINFRDRPSTIVPLRSSEVLVKNAGSPDHPVVYEVRAADLHGASTDLERRATIARILQPITGPVEVESYTPVADPQGKVVAYDAVISR